MERTLLVVGARAGSLGSHVLAEARDLSDRVGTFERIRSADTAEADVTGSLRMDITSRKDVVSVLEEVRPTDVVCTAGINLPDGGEPGFLFSNMVRQLQVNTMGPVMLLEEAIDFWNSRCIPPRSGFNFCVVSSNSAHVARSESAGYCASKAALSMAVRCIARRVAGRGVTIWGYEPGWMNGTPMSSEVHDRLGGDVRPHRIPGGKGIHPREVANRIVADMAEARGTNRGIHGTMVRLDGGEQ